MVSSEQDSLPFDPNRWRDACALKPLSGSILNEGLQAHLNLKRKRCEPSAPQELGQPFVILGSVSTTNPAPLKLQPKILIPRSSFPLAYLDLEFPQGEDAALRSRFFSARVKALQVLEVSEDTLCESKILIVENCDGHELYAVEGVQHNIYTLCRLNNWVTLGDLGKEPVKARKIVHGGSATNTTKADPWWKAAIVELKRMDDSGRRNSLYARNVQLAMKPSNEMRPAEPVLEVSKAGFTTTTSSSLEPHNKQADTINGGEVTHSTEPVDILGMIRAQYLEALYMSKTSLAYFAKGPLSRARATVQDTSSSMTISELNQSLREKILSISTNDKKYNETLPSLVKEIPLGVTSEDESGLLCDEIRKSKKRKKIGKGGLYPGEEEYAIKWWLRREKNVFTAGPGDSREDRVRVALVEQRARETQLQIILILEILSLEATNVHIATVLGPVLVMVEDSTAEHPAQTKKPRKPQNLEILLDILLDRLCIWHTTSQEDSEAAHDIQRRPKFTDSTSDGDHLRSFCVEVVVPFYATRLSPELYRSICQKLGGPPVPSPARMALHKASASSRDIPRPGTNVQRTDPKSRLPLQRVLTEDKFAHRKSHPTLTRSATDSALPGIKRELSDLALSTIPTRRPSLQHSKRYSQREVDLTAVSQATEAKLQRKAAIEQELQGAIAALKKPNPRLAVKELVESADRRVAGASKPRKSKNPVWNPLGQGVQVMATPKHNRLKNIHPRLPRSLHSVIAKQEDPDVIPPSSDPRVPSSSIKPPAQPAFTNASSIHSLFPTQITTPSHRLSKLNTSLGPPHSTNHDEDELSQSSTAMLALPLTHNADEDELSQPSPALPSLPRAQLPFKRPLPPRRMPSFESPACNRLSISTPSRKGPARSSLVAETPSRKPLARRAQGVVAGTLMRSSLGTRNNAVGTTPSTPSKASSAAKSAQGAPGAASGPDAAAKGHTAAARGRETSIYQALGWEDEVYEVDEVDDPV
ncbi:hypothetical protein MMC17_005299 [Xylographa soralifera]|nr:hypothetical protein [Xylographa soralifera]